MKCRILAALYFLLLAGSLSYVPWEAVTPGPRFLRIPCRRSWVWRPPSWDAAPGSVEARMASYLRVDVTRTTLQALALTAVFAAGLVLIPRK